MTRRSKAPSRRAATEASGGWVRLLEEAVFRGVLKGLRGSTVVAPSPRPAGPTRRERVRSSREVPTESAPADIRVGQVVRYRQGRGEFEALVVAVNEAKGLVRLKRVSDGKRVERPISKVYG